MQHVVQQHKLQNAICCQSILTVIMLGFNVKVFIQLISILYGLAPCLPISSCFQNRDELNGNFDFKMQHVIHQNKLKSAIFTLIL